MSRLELPEMCRACYWKLSGCEPPEDERTCIYYTPYDYDEYEPENNTWDMENPWADGYEVFESAEAMVEYFRRDDV